MANTIAKAVGADSRRIKEVHRLGSEYAVAEANTWRTFTTTMVRKDGSGFMKVTRDGEILHQVYFGPEGEVSHD